MQAASLEEYFTSDEIEILYAITATQVRAEQSAELSGDMENPYLKGMRSWVEKLSSDDAAFMTRSLAVAAKYDGIDKDRALHSILIARVMQR